MRGLWGSKGRVSNVCLFLGGNRVSPLYCVESGESTDILSHTHGSVSPAHTHTMPSSIPSRETLQSRLVSLCSRHMRDARNPSPSRERLEAMHSILEDLLHPPVWGARGPLEPREDEGSILETLPGILFIGFAGVLFIGALVGKILSL